MIERILVVGAGNMGGSLIRGLLRVNPAQPIFACDSSNSR